MNVLGASLEKGLSMSASLHMSPMQWASLPDIADVPAITGADHECLDAIREVLIRHNALGRFGVHLMHKHFEVAEDEVLVEYTDVEARTLNCKVEKRSLDAGSSINRIETMWSFAGKGATRVCDQQCVYNSGHANRHYSR
jgi:hypothetical protein